MDLRPSDTSTALMLSLSAWTFATGMIDAVTYLRLDHVFTANMTGNVVFLGMALAGEGTIPVLGVTAAIAGFALGALLSGRLLIPRMNGGRLVLITVGLQACCVLIAVGIILGFGVVVPALTAVLSFAMGMQNAAARKLSVPDMTTTVLTLTVTGLAADRSTGAQRGRRALMVLLMLLGAASGSLLVLTLPLWVAITLLLVILALTAITATRDDCSH